MKAIAFLVLAGLLSAQQPKHDYPVTPVPFTAVHVTDQFWAPKIETNRTVTIPFAFQKSEETGRVDNFIRAAQGLRGEPHDTKAPGYPFDDSDLYKVIEGASYSLAVVPDTQLETYIDSLIEKIGAAQEQDGYLYTTRAISSTSPHPWAGPKRWVLESVDSHELYNLGHLYEAAVAYYQATGKRTLLDIALKSADLLDRTFGPGKLAIWPGHQITEMGLAKLYRMSGDPKYLNLAKFMLDSRGPDGRQGSGRTYNQSHLHVTEQTEAVGHAVRGTYMYSGMADVAALAGDQSYTKAIDTIWENVSQKKLYITGGIGATGSGEAFGKNYELPNMTAYNETCASISNGYWNHRLFLLHGDSRYIDVFERTLYNGLISGVSLDGKSFFYPNPLESNGQHQRSPWFGVACCPSNITRFMASVPGYVYAKTDDAIWVNLFMSNEAKIELKDGLSVKMTQQTRYPWDGAVRMTVSPSRPATLSVKVRIPGWARNEPVPGDLYRFADRSTELPVVRVNGKAVALNIDKGYTSITREWKPNDLIELTLPMPVRRVLANDQVSADRGRVALQRGPVVYAAEWVDNPNGKVRNLMLSDRSTVTAEFKPDLLKGVTILKAKGVALQRDVNNNILKTDQDLIAIPYYAWANRGKGQMIVWLPNAESSAHPAPYPTIATQARVTTSGRKSPEPIHDGELPTSSADNSSYFDWWPAKGKTEWVEYALAKPTELSESSVYWFDDTGHGEVRVPASWRILYKDATGEWKPVTGTTAYTNEKDKLNRVTFERVTTTALRLEVTMQPSWSAGLQEWQVK